MYIQHKGTGCTGPSQIGRGDLHIQHGDIPVVRCAGEGLCGGIERQPCGQVGTLRQSGGIAEQVAVVDVGEAASRYGEAEQSVLQGALIGNGSSYDGRIVAAGDSDIDCCS